MNTSSSIVSAMAVAICSLALIASPGYAIQKDSDDRWFEDAKFELYCVTVSKDGERFCFGTPGRVVVTNDAFEQKSVLEITSSESRKQQRVAGIVLSDDERVVALTVTEDYVIARSRSTRGRVEIWNLEEKKKLLEVPGEEQEIFSVALSSDGGIVAVATEDGVECWNTDDASRVARLEAAAAPVSICSDGEHVLAARNLVSNSLGKWNLRTGELIVIANLADGERALAFANDGEFVATTRGLSQVESKRIKRLYELPAVSAGTNVPIRARFSPDGGLCVFVQHGVESSLNGRVICVDPSGAASKPFVAGSGKHPQIVFDAAADGKTNSALALVGWYLPVEYTVARVAVPLKLDVKDRIK